MWWLIIPVLLLAFLLFAENRSQNCVNKITTNSTPPMLETDTIKQGVDKTIDTLRKSHTVVSWRRAVILGLMFAIPISYLVLRRFPAGFEFLGITFLICVGAYFSSVWFEYHWWYGRNVKIEQELLKLRNK